MKCSSHRAMRSALNYVNTKHIICLKQTIFLQILCIDIAINSICYLSLICVQLNSCVITLTVYVTCVAAQLSSDGSEDSFCLNLHVCCNRASVQHVLHVMHYSWLLQMFQAVWVSWCGAEYLGQVGDGDGTSDWIRSSGLPCWSRAWWSQSKPDAWSSKVSLVLLSSRQ